MQERPYTDRARAGNTADSTFATWAAESKLKTACMVIDMSHPSAVGIDACVASVHALALLEIARGTSARFVVLAGQLAYPNAGVFGQVLMDPAPEELELAVDAAWHRLDEMGETTSMWMTFADGQHLAAVQRVLTRLKRPGDAERAARREANRAMSAARRSARKRQKAARRAQRGR